MSEMDIDIKLIKLGSKFFRYLDNEEEPEVIRIYGINTSKCAVKYFDHDGNKGSMPAKDLLANYKLLRPDGIFSASIVNIKDSNSDVIAMLGLPNEGGPSVVCRQCIYDFFTNNARKTDMVTYVGVSVSKKTCPANIDFNAILSCDELKTSTYVCVYLDDTLDDILKLFNTRKYDTILRTLAISHPYVNGNVAMGYCSSLKELLENNNFMYDFRQAFGIKEVPFAIDEETEGLSLENIMYLENELKVNIMETYLIRYTREIDLKTIKRDYLLVSSAAENHSKIYIVGYDTADGEYVPRTTV